MKRTVPPDREPGIVIGLMIITLVMLLAIALSITSCGDLKYDPNTGEALGRECPDPEKEILWKE